MAGIARANRLREHCLKLMQETPCPSVFRVYWRTTHVTGSAIEAKAAFSAPGNLSAHDHYDEFDRARLTAAANVPLALLLIAFVVALTSADYANLANGVTMQLIATRIYHDFDPKAGEEYELRDRLFRTGERSFVLIVAGELPGDLKSKSRSVSQACLVGMLS